MNHLHNLRERLQARKDKFYTVRYDDFVGETKLFLDFLRRNSTTAILMESIDTAQTATFEQWWDEAQTKDRISLPSNEIGRARVCMGILADCIDDDRPDQHFQWAHWLGSVEGEDDVAAFLAAKVVEPLFYFLYEQIGNSSNVLHLLQRFKAKAEWFRREELHAGYVACTRHGEERLDRALREFLFDGGIDFPFSQPNSPSGQADIVASLGSDDPLVLEVKVFDPERSKGKSHLRQGFHQVVRYADDYNESAGHLVVFNCSRGLLTLPSGIDQSEGPPSVVYNEKTFFLIAIDIGIDRASASKESPASRTDISMEELTGPAS